MNVDGLLLPVDFVVEFFKVCFNEVKVDAVLVFLCSHKEFACSVHCEEDFDRDTFDSVRGSELVPIWALVLRQACKAGEGFHQ